MIEKKNSRLSFATVTLLDRVRDFGDETNANSHGAVCPICRRTGAQQWMRAPDRLHGRREEYILLRCPGCSLVWLDNAPRPEEMHHHYTDAYHRLISGAGENSPDRWRDRIDTLRHFKQSGALLDLGCSSGGFLSAFATDVWKLYGIEMSVECAKRAEATTGADVFVGDVPDAPFPANMFDVITCFDVLEHMYQPLRVMTKVREWLKPNGIFYVQVPNIDSAEARLFRSYWHGLEMPRHLFHFNPKSLATLADGAGLVTASLETRRNNAVGVGVRYMWHDACRAAGITKTPVAYRAEPGIAWRAARKLVRLTALRLALSSFPLFGDGESIHAVFRKEKMSS